jgi:hypothetical protein
MVSRKTRRPIAEDEIPLVFDDACIGRLASIRKLPDSVDRQRLAKGVREAAQSYARNARKPSINKPHYEIKALYDAALRRQYSEVASLLACLSPQAHSYLSNRLRRPGPRAAGLRLPSPNELFDTATRQIYRGRPGGLLLSSSVSRRDDACENIERLCRVGGNIIEGRTRPSGSRSRPVLRPLFPAPTPQRHLPKRQAELTFVGHLGAAWLLATGKPPARTADRRTPGPFARFVQECLQLVGAIDASAVKLINELGRRDAAG